MSDAALHVMWHDVECGSYGADLPVWRRLAEEAGGPLLDVGSGTGRVSLDLAGRGHDVTALDRDAALLAELARRARAARLPIATAEADARSFALGRAFALILVPMQTVQLLEGGHGEFLAAAAEHLRPGGLLACAVARPQAFAGGAELPLPDLREAGGWIYCSQPVSVRPTPGGMAIERVREVVSPAGERTVTNDVVVLADLAPEQLEQAGAEQGLDVLPRISIAETDDHVASDVVVLRRA